MAVVKKRAKGALPSVLDTLISICWINNYCDTDPRLVQVTIKALAEQFTVPETNRGRLTQAEYAAADKKTKRGEKDGRAFIPAIFAKSKTRCQEDVRAVTAFVLDFDGPVTRMEFEAKLKSFCYVAYTTYSHSVEMERWRVVIFYAVPASASDHALIYSHFHKLFGGRLDERAKTLNQIWYSPGCPPDAGALFRSFVNDAPLLVPSEIVASECAAGGERAAAQKGAPNPPMPALNADEMDHVVDALRYICADDREIWIKVGMALKQGAPCGDPRAVWLQWSKKSKKYDETDAIYNWESFKGKDGGVALGTIYYLARQAGWGPTSVDAAISAEVAELNADNFVARENGKTCVFREKRDEAAGRQYLERMTPKDLIDFYQNRKITIGKKQVGLGTYWMGSPDRRQYNDVIFLPNGNVEGSYNLWRGFSVKPRRGNWSKMRNHIKKVICAGNKELNEYVLGWMASAVQYPERPAEVALVLQGARGTGKGSFVHAFGHLFGQHYLQVTQARHLVGNFNSHLRDCIVLLADEAFWAGDRQGESVLKALVTEPTIMIEPKGINSFSVINYLHIIIATNNAWAVPAGERERRYCMLQVSDIHAQDTQYFAALRSEMDNGGLGAMLYDSQKMDLSTFNIRKVPYTDGLREQMLHTLSLEMSWWYEELQSGAMWSQPQALGVSSMNDVSLPPNSIPRSALQERFAEACRGLYAGRGSVTRLGILLAKVLPKGWPQEVRPPMADGRPGTRYYVLPSLAVAREHFAKTTGIRMCDIDD